LTRHRYSKHELRARRHNSTRHSFKLPAARDLAANIGQAILAIESYASRASRHGMFSTRACIKHARFIQKPPRDAAKMKWFAATLPETRMKAAAASLLVKSNLGSFLFRSSRRRRRIFMHGDWLAD
jgi:hypothetical protein